MIKQLVRNIKGLYVQLSELASYCKNDSGSWLGLYKHRYKIIFIAGLPKSGTTWIETQLAHIPGYNIRNYKDPDGCTLNHNVCSDVFRSLPQRRYSVLKLHTCFSEKNFSVIRNYVPRFVVTIRDLRDMCISRYFYCKGKTDHHHYDLYNRISKEEGITHSIEVVGNEYVAWVADWVKTAKQHPEVILLISYEELNSFPMETFKKVLDFFELRTNARLLKTFADSKLTGQTDLKRELASNISFRQMSTKRKGVRGDWKNHFTPNHKENFKKIGGEILIQLGYEKDDNW